jgi:hypothetical protein
MPAKPHANPTAPAKPIVMKPVNSSTIKSVGYDEPTSNLQVEFIHGGHYMYHGVPKQLYHQLIGAPSVGSFFHRNVKDKHKFTKLK